MPFDIFYGYGFLTLTIFISGLFIKYTILKDKESKGLKWLISGGMMYLLYVVTPLTRWSTIFSDVMFLEPVTTMILTVGFILVLIGSIKIIIELLFE